MELKEFVAETLKQIVGGVKDAQAAVKGEGGEINPPFFISGEAAKGILIHREHDIPSGKAVHIVEFDVALTVVEGKGTKGGIGVFVGPVGIGTQGQSSSENASVSRIKFQVPITLPQPQG